MQKIILALFMLIFSVSSAAAHGGISKLPDSVQIMQYKMLLYMDADDTATRNNLAMAYFRNGDLTKASEELTTVLEKDTKNFDALDGMGIVLLRQKKSAEALKYLEQALAINEKDSLLHVHLSLAYQQLKKTELADKAMETAKKQASTPEAIAEIQEEVKLITQS